MIDKLAWLYIQNRKLLMTRSKNKSVWYIPGGKREVGESDHVALKREIQEELNVTLVPATIQFLGTFEDQADGHPDGIVVRMTCYSADYAGVLNPSAEIEEMAWFSFADRDRSSFVDQKIFDWLLENNLID
ncbi:MAG: NUDIX domain-containing protein [Chloroflexota bacterium]